MRAPIGMVLSATLLFMQGCSPRLDSSEYVATLALVDHDTRQASFRLILENASSQDICFAYNDRIQPEIMHLPTRFIPIDRRNGAHFFKYGEIPDDELKALNALSRMRVVEANKSLQIDASLKLNDLLLSTNPDETHKMTIYDMFSGYVALNLYKCSSPHLFTPEHIVVLNSDAFVFQKR